MASPQEWDSLGESIRVRKIPLYTMGWDVTEAELAQGQVIGCAFGGPVCVLREDIDTQSLEVSVYSQSGRLLKKFTPAGFRNPLITSIAPSSSVSARQSPIRTQQRLVRGGAGWSGVDELLTLVSESGIMVVFEASSFRETTINLESQIVLAGCEGGNVICLCADDTVLCISELKNCFSNGIKPKGPRIDRFATPSLHSPIRTMSFYHAADDKFVLVTATARDDRLTRYELSYSAQLMTSPAGKQLRLATDTGAHFQHPSSSSSIHGHHSHPHGGASGSAFRGISISPSTSTWAVADTHGEIFILEEPTMKKLARLKTDAGMAPLQLTWCGDEILAASFPSDMGVLLIGKQEDWVKVHFPSAVRLVPEVDCIRILTTNTHELVERVSPSLDDSLRIGSCAPAAMLLDASESLSQNDGKAYENIRALRLESLLFPAVTESIRASLGEFDTDQQQMLLRAAAAGKVFLTETRERQTATRAFVKASTYLQVLNTVRHENIGLPITIHQLYKMGKIPGLCMRLAKWNHHFLALKALDRCGHSLSNQSQIQQVRRAIALHWARKTVASVCPAGYVLFPRLFPPQSLPLTPTTPAIATNTTRPTTTANDQSNPSLLRILPKIFSLPGSQLLAQQQQQHVKANDPVMSASASSLIPLVPSRPSTPASTKEAQEIASKILAKFKSMGLPYPGSALAKQAMLLGNRDLALELLGSRASGDEVERPFLSLVEKVTRLVQFQELERALRLSERMRDAELIAFVKSFMSNPPSSTDSKKPGGGADIGSSKKSSQVSSFVERLLEEQKKLDASAHLSGKSTSVLEAIRSSIVATGDEKHARELQKEFGVSDLSMWTCKIRAYASRRDWSRIEQLTKERKHKAGVVISICCQLGFPTEALRYVQFVQDKEEQVDCLLECEDFVGAIKRLRASDFPAELREGAVMMVRARLTMVEDKMSEQDRAEIEGLLGAGK